MSNGGRASPDWDALTEAAQIRPDLLNRSHVVQAPQRTYPNGTKAKEV